MFLFMFLNLMLIRDELLKVDTNIGLPPFKFLSYFTKANREHLLSISDFKDMEIKFHS